MAEVDTSGLTPEQFRRPKFCSSCGARSFYPTDKYCNHYFSGDVLHQWKCGNCGIETGMPQRDSEGTSTT